MQGRRESQRRRRREAAAGSTRGGLAGPSGRPMPVHCGWGWAPPLPLPVGRVEEVKVRVTVLYISCVGPPLYCVSKSGGGQGLKA